MLTLGKTTNIRWIKQGLGALTTLTVLTTLTACTNDSQGPAPTELTTSVNDALEQAIDYSVLPAVAGFQARAKALNSAADTFCNQQNADNLTTLQQTWRDSFLQWYRLSLYNFGPLNDDFVLPTYTFIDSLRLRGTNYLGTVRSDITRDIASTKTLDDAHFANKTFQRVGLLPLEALIFETSSSEHSQNTTDILAEYASEPRKCLILKGVASQLLVRAESVNNGWSTTFKQSPHSYRTLFLGNQLEDGTAPLSQLLISAQEFLDYLKARKVVNNTARLSNTSWDALAVAINEVTSLLSGTNKTSASFFSIMTATGHQNEVADVRQHLAEARDAIANRNVDMLHIALGELDGNFKREIPDALDVNLGINFSDGD